MTCAKPHLVARHTSDTVGSKGGGLLAVHKQVAYVVGAVERIDQLVPLSVGIVSAGDEHLTAVAQYDIAVLQTDEYFALGIIFPCKSASCSEQGCGVGRLRVGLEPQHKGEVLGSRTRQQVVCQADTIGAVQPQRHTLWECPRGALQT